MRTVHIPSPAGFDFQATVKSHGWYDLAPFHAGAGALERVILVGNRAHDLTITARNGALEVAVDPPADAEAVRAQVAAMLRLDEDLSALYAMTDGDPKLAWARRRGAGRLLRAPTAFEDVVKMLLTTNCSWSFTRLMVERLVEHLGPAAPSGRRAFPTAARMAAKPARFYRDVVRAGYRSSALAFIARQAARGRLDLEPLRQAGDPEAVRDRLLALPGIGPYAADNLLRLCGDYGYLGLDSWCRGKLKRLYPRVRDVDAGAQRRYRRYGAFQGLAMWLDLTRDWHEPANAAASPATGGS